jgi:hypothetical protein
MLRCRISQEYLFVLGLPMPALGHKRTISELLAGTVLHHERGADVLDRQGQREAAFRHGVLMLGRSLD